MILSDKKTNIIDVYSKIKHMYCLCGKHLRSVSGKYRNLKKNRITIHRSTYTIFGWETILKCNDCPGEYKLKIYWN